jgi:uncharacterized protein YndB with AHSA1/START domain/DNA-binding transcriptional ArsR family regulator
MEATLAALADPARWRLVSLLAERPRPVGVLAQLAGARQPQTTKHLQTLERAGVVSSQRSGQRRIYALSSEPLRELAAELVRLAEAAGELGGARATFERHGLSLEAERLAAQEDGWADDRSFHFRRWLPAAPDVVWRHLTDETLLASWWAPDDLRVSEVVLEAREGGRIVLEYRDVEDADGTDEVVGRAEGVVADAVPGARLTYQLSPLLADGSPAFTSAVDHRLTPTDSGTELDVDWRLSDSTVGGADFVAGIELGFGQSLDKLAAVLAEHDTTHTDRSQK